MSLVRDNSSRSHFSAMTRPCWPRRAVRNRHRHAIKQASRRWRGGQRDDSARRRRNILISTQVAAAAATDAIEERCLRLRARADSQDAWIFRAPVRFRGVRLVAFPVAAAACWWHRLDSRRYRPWRLSTRSWEERNATTASRSSLGRRATTSRTPPSRCGRATSSASSSPTARRPPQRRRGATRRRTRRGARRATCRSRTSGSSKCLSCCSTAA